MLARRLGLGLACVGKGKLPQRLKTEIMSDPTHLTGIEWCVEALCKCTQTNAKRAERNNMQSTTLGFYFHFFCIYFYRFLKFRV